MATPRFYNSLTKKLEEFTPREPGKVQVYHCGPTVYKRQHIGNMRRFLFADILRRALEFWGYEVREITNITDVGHLTRDDIDAGEDKVAREAQRQKTTPQDIARRETERFFADLKLINVEPSQKYPRASEHVEEMQELIAALLKSGHAYQNATGIYFDVTSFPRYGELSGNKLADIEAGKRIAVREEKKHPADFALWIFDEKALQKWESPWGTGYPGWHIECSAMSLKYLEAPIDIHTGGEDNKFPHHENEIAQSEGATGKTFVRFWMHNRHLRLNGQKLAKREGEQVTLDTLTEKGFSPLAFRWLVFGSHYRSLMDFSWEGLQAAQQNINSLKNLLRRLPAAQGEGEVDETILNAFSEALEDDLNTPKALAVVMDYLRSSNATAEKGAPAAELKGIRTTLKKLDNVLGVIEALQSEIEAETAPEEVKALAQAREAARQAKQFDEADQLRQKIEELGFSVEDTASGPRLIRN